MAKSTSSSSMDGNTSVSTIEPIPASIDPSQPVTTTRPNVPRTTTRQTFAKATHKLTKPFKNAPPIFNKFPDLPTEIRLQIWEATLTARVHELHPCAHLYHNRMTFRSNASTTPSIFHVSRESREVALKHYQLMEYTPGNPRNEDGGGTGKGILRFYFAPKIDTLLLNSLMGLFVMFMLLEEGSPDSILSTGGPTAGVMKGWERVAIDAERAQLITLLSGIAGHAPQPRFKQLLPNLKELVIAFDYTRKGKTRFRTSVWPGENGTTLGRVGVPRGMEEDWVGIMEGCLAPLRGFLKSDYAVVQEAKAGDAEEDRDSGEESDEDGMGENGVPSISVAKVMRKRFVRGDLRYAFRWSCSLIGVRPRGIFRRL